MDLYQTSLEQNGKQFDSHSNALKKANAEVNNTLVMHNFNAPINIKGLKISKKKIEDSNGKIDHIGGGGSIIDPNN